MMRCMELVAVAVTAWALLLLSLVLVRADGSGSGVGAVMGSRSSEGSSVNDDGSTIPRHVEIWRATPFPALRLQWSPVDAFDDNDNNANNNAVVERAVVTVPLCYDAFCIEFRRQLDLNVTRWRSATGMAQSSRPMLWAISEEENGGNEASVLFESVGEVADVYSLQFRGSVSIKSSTVTRKGATTLDFAQSTLESAELTFGAYSQAGFSLTSTAIDLVMVAGGVQQAAAEEQQQRPKVFVYAAQRTTAIVRRMMQLEKTRPLVTGYFMDSMVGDNVSTLDSDFGQVVDQFLTFLETQPDVRRYFKGTTLRAALRKLYDRVEQRDPSLARCRLAMSYRSTEGVSGLQQALSAVVRRDGANQLLPAIIYRMARCNVYDARYVTKIVYAAQSAAFAKTAIGTDINTWAWNLIQFSEMWERPPPSYEQLAMRSRDAIINEAHVPEQFAMYCLYARSPECAEVLRNVTPSASLSWKLYDLDRYAMNRTDPINLPANTSLIIWSSRSDPIFSANYAAEFYDRVSGPAHKILVKSLGPGGLFTDAYPDFSPIAKASAVITRRYGTECAGRMDRKADDPFARDCGAASALNLFVRGQLQFSGVYSSKTLLARTSRQNGTEGQKNASAEDVSLDAIIDSIVRPSDPLAWVWMGTTDAYDGVPQGLWTILGARVCWGLMAMLIIILIVGHWKRPTRRRCRSQKMLKSKESSKT